MIWWNEQRRWIFSMLVAIVQSPKGLNMTRRPEPLSVSAGSVFSFSCTSWILVSQSSAEVRVSSQTLRHLNSTACFLHSTPAFLAILGLASYKTNHFPVRNLSRLVQSLLDGPTKASSKYPNALLNHVALHKLADHSFITMFSLYQDPLNAKITFPSGILSEILLRPVHKNLGVLCHYSNSL